MSKTYAIAPTNKQKKMYVHTATNTNTCYFTRSYTNRATTRNAWYIHVKHNTTQPM